MYFIATDFGQECPIQTTSLNSKKLLRSSILVFFKLNLWTVKEDKVLELKGEVGFFKKAEIIGFVIIFNKVFIYRER